MSNIVYDYSYLRSKIVKKYGTITKFSCAVPQSRTYVSRVLNNRRYLPQDVMDDWIQKLEIEDTEIVPCFFLRK